jgi:tetratricopeptide (TPR) repeat protein
MHDTLVPFFTRAGFSALAAGTGGRASARAARRGQECGHRAFSTPVQAAPVAVFLFACGAALPLAAHPETAEARAQLDRMIAEFPQEPDLLVQRAAVARDEGAWAAAEADLRRALQLAPRSAQAHAQLAEVLAVRGDLARAEREASAALALAPRDAEALVRRAQIRARRGAAEAAYGDFTAAIGLLEAPSPDLFLARAALAVPPERALRGIDEGLARLGPAAPLVERALALELRLGRIDAALARLEVLAATGGRRERLLKRRGDILAAAGRAHDARSAYGEALAAIAALPDWLRETPGTAQLARELAGLAAPSI